MHRRTCLASLATLATGGCLGSPMSQTAPDRPRRTVAVSGVERRAPPSPERLDDDERPTGLEFDVEIVDGGITSGSTARIRLAYTNAGEETLELNIDPARPDPLPAVEADPGLVLLSGGYEPTRASTGCWKPEEESFPQPAVARQHPVGSGERESLAYEVWAAPGQAADCIRPGAYAFRPLFGSFTLTVSTDA